MEKLEFNVYPNMTQTVKIVKATVEVIEMQLFKSATIRVILLDEYEKTVDIKLFVLDESNGYNDWKTDDYIVDWVQKELKIGKYS